MEGISIIVCCYNSEQRLPKTIKHLACQKVSVNVPFEVIIVNNNSTDNTNAVALAEIKLYPNLGSRSIIIDELKPGLSHARLKGVEMAKYEFIVFCDDDNWLDKNYVELAFQLLDTNPNIGACGGQSKAVSNIKFPDWFEDCKGNYAIGKQAASSQDITWRKYLWGAGIVLRKKNYIDAFQIKSLLVGRNGASLASGDDSEICARLILMGYDLYYSEELVFHHYLPKERLTIDYKDRLFQGHKESFKIIKKYWDYIDFVIKPRPKLWKFFLRKFIGNILNLRKFKSEDIEHFLLYTRLNFGGKDSNYGCIYKFYQSVKNIKRL